MNRLILTVLALVGIHVSAFANQDKDFFHSKVITYDCNEERKILNLTGTCLIIVQNHQDPSSEFIGLVLHSDMYFHGSKYIYVGSHVIVDLVYTNKAPHLKSFFSKRVTRVYFHDSNTSYGGYEDVINLLRR